jgi:adenylosuccinate lyase
LNKIIQLFIYLSGVKAGGDRQEIHEAIRVHSMAAGALVKGEGKSNDLLERIASDPLFKAVHDKLDTLIDPRLFVGRAMEQTAEFLAEEIMPILEKEKEALGKEIVDGVNV